MTTDDLDKILKKDRQKIVTEFFDKHDIECVWLGILRMTLNGIHFTWYTDFSGIEIDIHRTDSIDGKKLEKIFYGKNLHDFTKVADLIKNSKTIHASRKLYTLNSKTGVFEKVKYFSDFK